MPRLQVWAVVHLPDAVPLAGGREVAGRRERRGAAATVSGIGPSARVHILVKPIRPDIATNLVINTDRRTYHLELRANALVYMASVSWTYPQDQLIALRQARAEAELVNYRVAGRYMIVDRLFGAAQLRLGGQKGQDKVRIVLQRRGRV